MSLLILGPQSPKNAIDVYLRPLIDELRLLWDVGVESTTFYFRYLSNSIDTRMNRMT